MSYLEICKNGFVDLLYCHFMDEGYFDEDDLKADVQHVGLTLDSWVTVHDPVWTDTYPFYYAYLVWKSTTGQYGFITFDYLPKESEGRKRRMIRFDTPISKEDLIERFTRFEKEDGHNGLLKSLDVLESDVSDDLDSVTVAE